MYSEIWLPDLLDTASWVSSRFNSRLNCQKQSIQQQCNVYSHDSYIQVCIYCQQCITYSDRALNRMFNEPRTRDPWLTNLTQFMFLIQQNVLVKLTPVKIVQIYQFIRTKSFHSIFYQFLNKVSVNLSQTLFQSHQRLEERNIPLVR